MNLISYGVYTFLLSNYYLFHRNQKSYLEILKNLRRKSLKLKRIRKLEIEVRDHFISFVFSLINFSCSLKV